MATSNDDLSADLFKRTLGARQDDSHARERDRLRNAFFDFRTKATMLAGEIARDLPNYTEHGISHLDALWETADLIAGPDYAINPAEAFVLGCAFLLHDLAMTKAAYPEGIEAVIGQDEWRESLFIHFKAINGMEPSAEDLDNPQPEVVRAAEAELLRDFHAKRATLLIQQKFKDPNGGSTHMLLSDTELRNSYGDLIGRLAASHWWPLSEVAAKFLHSSGVPTSLPREWSVNQLKIACLVRTADAAHIDSRRAPEFLRAIRQVTGPSRDHWIFQERLDRPEIKKDRLVYTAHQPFAAEEAAAWWLCVETLRMIDSELRAVDTLLHDRDQPRFQALGVAHVKDPAELAHFIRVDGWHPIDARVRISNVIALVKKLGGENLYGDDPEPALRELISNAADAIRARRRLIQIKGRPNDLRFRIQLSLDESDKDTWLVVADNGIGMTKEALSGVLLDFGNSYWSSLDVRREFPGLISSGFSPTGKFGIGFFSVFMLGEEIHITSRRYDQGSNETHLLRFDSGLDIPPILQLAKNSDAVPYGGTEIRVRLNERSKKRFTGINFAKMCQKLCPTLDVDIDFIASDSTVEQVITADDWMSMPASDLIDRLTPEPDAIKQPANRTFVKFSESDRIKPILDAGGHIIGRGALVGNDNSDTYGIITVHGVLSSVPISHFIGVVEGETSDISRRDARPKADFIAMKQWTNEQIDSYKQRAHSKLDEIAFTDAAYILGGNINDLVIAQIDSRYITTQEICEEARRQQQIRLVSTREIAMQYGDQLGTVELVSLLAEELIVVQPYFSERADWSNGSDQLETWPEMLNYQNAAVDICIAQIHNTWGRDETRISYEEVPGKSLLKHHENVKDETLAAYLIAVKAMPDRKVPTILFQRGSVDHDER